MGWLPASVVAAVTAAAEQLTAEQRQNLTWEEAQKFVLADTLDLAKWESLRRSGRSPWEAVAALRGLPTAPPAS